MNDHFSDYYWKNGKPYGKHKATLTDEITYRVVADPYYKRITLEKYQKGKFLKVIYDSIFLDFRHLKAPEQAAWLREILTEEPHQTQCIIRNQDDRAILMETSSFQQNRCRHCLISSIHGLPISIHRMHYTTFNDTFDGVILYDMEERQIMIKKYTLDPETGDIRDLISEEWNMENHGKTL